MEFIDDIQQYQIYVHANLVEPGCWEFVYSNGNKYLRPQFDFYLPLFLTRKYDTYEYVEVFTDDKIYPIQRQEINPYFIELSFFDTIQQHKVLRGIDLTVDIINFIREKRVDTSEFSDQEVIMWFDNIGANELPWFPNTDNEITADDLDLINFNETHTISKADYFNIDINK
jgi:hypothetical protein